MTSLKHFRDAKGMSQRKLATMSGVSAPMVCRIESGEREPTYPILEKLAMALDLDDRERGTLYFDYNILPKRDPGAMKGVMDEIRFWFVE